MGLNEIVRNYVIYTKTYAKKNSSQEKLLKGAYHKTKYC